MVAEKSRRTNKKTGAKGAKAKSPRAKSTKSTKPDRAKGVASAAEHKAPAKGTASAKRKAPAKSAAPAGEAARATSKRTTSKRNAAKSSGTTARSAAGKTRQAAGKRAAAPASRVGPRAKAAAVSKRASAVDKGKSTTTARKASATKAAARKTPAAKASAAETRKPAAGVRAAGKLLGTVELARERTAGRIKRAVRRVASSVAEGVAAAIKPAPRPASALRPAAKPRPGRARGRAAAVPGVVIKGRMGPRYPEILSPGALAFLAELHRRFEESRRELLAARAERQARFDAGELPDFLAETKDVRDGDWTVGPIPADLTDRRVEITGPVDRKMIINALNSGATHFMADLEDANSPTWANVVEGQLNLRDRFEDRIDFIDETTGKRYAIGEKPAVLIVRPRGWHLLEEHLTVDGEPISGALFDFGLFFFHNAKRQLARGTGPYFYLPKLESHREARLWNDVFVQAQDKLGIPRGTIKATVLIETLPAAFEMDEILFELKEHAAGLNAGRWDYIFSFIKTFAKRADYVLPDRGQVVMGKAFLGAYAGLLVKTCHRRRAFAMGGMAAQIPIKNDPTANEAAFAKVRADKEREVNGGHDGTWVAHPDLVPVAKDVFDRLMPQQNQLDRRHDDVAVTQADLLRIHEGTRTEAGFRLNIRVGVQYIEAWLRGRGAVPIYNLMEDAATAEISRAQIWQWLQYGAVLDTGTAATPAFFEQALGEEMARVRGELGPEVYDAGRFPEAIALFRRLSLAPGFEDFLTLPAYKLIA